MQSTHFPLRVFYWAGLTLAALTWPASTPAQSNIVFNGSFEDGQAGWIWGPIIGVYWDQGAAEGSYHISVEGFLYQDLNTVAGRDYVLSYALRTDAPAPAVSWGGEAAGSFTNFGTVGALWTYRYCYVHAASNLTRLQFEGTRGVIDDVRVGWVQEPIRLLAQPQSRTAFEGSTVSFTVTADGAPPLQYQWLFNGAAIPDGSGHSLTVTPLRTNHAGQYSVRVSNSWNSVLSDAAQLQVVPPPTSPLIVFQPVGDICPAGYGCSLQVVAVGELPLKYQWSKDGTEVAGATNAGLSFEAVQTGNAGTYSVLVSNSLGTELSLPAVLAVTNTTGGGSVIFDTHTNNAPIFDVDGVTRLSGTNFLAQVYAGPTPGIVRPVGAPIPFPTGTFAGYLKDIIREVPDVAPDQIAYIQVRAWEAAWGSSYEEARALGGKFGFSPLAPTQTGSFLEHVPMQSFSLRAGEPFFITGRLSIGERPPGQPQQYILTGEAGARYLIEKRHPPQNWAPLLILTNTTGTAVFSDPDQSLPVQFYRSRILD